MKQVNVILNCPFFTVSKIFKAEDIEKQINFLQGHKKTFDGIRNKKATDVLKCTVEEIGFDKPHVAINNKSVQQNLPQANKNDYGLHEQPVASMMPVKAAPVIIVMDGLNFIYYPKRKKFICETQRSLTLTIAEVKGLNEHKLLTVPKAHKAEFNYFAN